MKTKASLSLIVASTMLLSACSFQKDPNKKAPAVPAPVKIGMTKEELREEISGASDIAFPDKLIMAGKKDDRGLVLKLINETTESEVNSYGKDGATALDLMVQHEADEYAVYLLQKGASPFKRRKGTTYTILDQIKSKSDIPYVKQVLPLAIDQLYQRGVRASDLPVSLFMFYWQTHFPIKIGVNGHEPLLMSILAEREMYKARARDSMQSSLITLLELVEEVEGEITEKVDEFREFTFEAEDYDAFMFFLNKKPLSEENRKALIAKMSSSTLYWLKTMDSLLKFSDEERIIVSKNFLETVKTSNLKILKKQFFKRSNINFLIEKYPDIYKALYLYLDAEKESVIEDMPLSGGLSPGKDKIPGENEYRRKEMYNNFLNDMNLNKYYSDWQ